MPTELTDTASATDAAPVTEAPKAPEAAVAQTPDELAQLKSRNQGLNAKVGSLEAERDTLRTELENARKGLTDKDAGDADLRAQLAAANAAVEAAKREAALGSLQGKYPEAFSELGEGALSLTPEKLASLEARLTAVKNADAEPETAKPIGNNPPKAGQSGAKSIEDMTSAELQAEMKKLTPADMGLAPRA